MSQQSSTNLKCIVISLPSAADRRSKVRENLDQCDSLNWDFFDALEADSPQVELPQGTREQIDHFGRALALNEIGCYKSHYHVLKAHSEENGWLLVIEDDVYIDEKFNIRELIDYLEKNKLLYVRLYAKRYKAAKVIGALSGFKQVVRFKTDPYGTQAYLIHSSGAKKFIQSQNRIVRPIDDEFGRFWVHHLWPISVFPFPAVERSVASSIDGEREEQNVGRKNRNPIYLKRRVVEKVRKMIANTYAPS